MGNPPIQTRKATSVADAVRSPKRAFRGPRSWFGYEKLAVHLLDLDETLIHP